MTSCQEKFISFKFFRHLLLIKLTVFRFHFLGKWFHTKYNHSLFLVPNNLSCSNRTHLSSFFLNTEYYHNPHYTLYNSSIIKYSYTFFKPQHHVFRYIKKQFSKIKNKKPTNQTKPNNNGIGCL